MMNYCSSCGARLSLKVPEGDNRPRHVCDGCGAVHYVNPKVVAGCLPVHAQQILLCRRAIEPRRGFWTLPAGFLEMGESTVEGALRETWEEAHANVSIEGLYTLFNLPHISQVYVFFRARLLDLDFHAGSESLEVALFDEADLPWDELAFPVIRDTLRYYLQDRRRNSFPTRVGDIIVPPRRQ